MENHHALAPARLAADGLKQKHVRVNKMGAANAIMSGYSRRDYGKIYLIDGSTQIRYEAGRVQTEGPILFLEPVGTYFLTGTGGAGDNFSCIFPKELLEKGGCSKSYLELMSLTQAGEMSFFLLDSGQKDFIVNVFQRMMLEQDSGYIFKYELLTDYINLIFHEVLKQKL